MFFDIQISKLDHLQVLKEKCKNVCFVFFIWICQHLLFRILSNKNDSRLNKRQCIPLKLNCAYKYNIKSICPQGLQVAHVYSLYSKPIFILLLPRIYILRVFWCSRGFKPLEMLNICISAKSNRIRLLFWVSRTHQIAFHLFHLLFNMKYC